MGGSDGIPKRSLDGSSDKRYIPLRNMVTSSWVQQAQRSDT